MERKKIITASLILVSLVAVVFAGIFFSKKRTDTNGEKNPVAIPSISERNPQKEDNLNAENTKEETTVVSGKIVNMNRQFIEIMRPSFLVKDGENEIAKLKIPEHDVNLYSQTNDSKPEKIGLSQIKAGDLANVTYNSSSEEVISITVLEEPEK